MHSGQSHCAVRANILRNRHITRLRRNIDLVLSACEREPDFWPNSRHFWRVGEYGLAFEGLYLYLLGRQDLEQKFRAIIKSVKWELRSSIDFDALEQDPFGVEAAKDRAWREQVARGFSEDS